MCLPTKLILIRFLRINRNLLFKRLPNAPLVNLSGGQTTNGNKSCLSIRRVSIVQFGSLLPVVSDRCLLSCIRSQSLRATPLLENNLLIPMPSVPVNPNVVVTDGAPSLCLIPDRQSPATLDPLVKVLSAMLSPPSSNPKWTDTCSGQLTKKLMTRHRQRYKALHSTFCATRTYLVLRE